MDEVFSKAIIEQIWSARQSSTIQKYCYALRKFFAFSCTFSEGIRLPINALEAAKYLAYMRYNSASHSSFKMIITAIKWINNFFPGISKLNCPMEDNFLLRLRDSALRHVHKTKNQKEPLKGCMINNIIGTLPKNPSLIQLRNILIPALGYSLLLRHDELSHLNCLYMAEDQNGLKITIPSSKTDVYRDGKLVVLARSTSHNSVYMLVQRYLEMSKLKFGTNQFFFPIIKSEVVTNQKLPYSFFLENIKNLVSLVGLNPKFFGTHSVRSGAASDLATKVTEFELLLTGRWRDPRSLASYVKVSEERRFAISRELSLLSSS